MGHQELFSTDQSNISVFQTVNVTSLNVFDTFRVGKIITLVGDVAFHITKSFSWEDVEFVLDPDANITFSTSNAVSNDITTTILTGRSLFSGALSRLEFKDVNMTSTNGGTCFNFTAGNNVVPALVISNPRIVGFDKVGILDGIATAIENVGYIGNADGWSINDAPFINMAEQNMVFGTGINYDITGTTPFVIYNNVLLAPLDANIAFNISGAVGTVVINTIFTTPQAGGYAFNIDSSITIGANIQILNGSLNTSLGGAMFDPSGLDETDPRILVQSVLNALDSRWISEIGFEDNSTVTAITINTPTDIAGTFTSGELERHTRSGGEVTYTGLEDITEAITVSAAIENATGGGRRDIQVHLLLDTGSGFAIVATHNASMSAEAVSLSFTKAVNSSTGDKYKAQVENIENNDDMLVIDLTITGAKV